MKYFLIGIKGVGMVGIATILKEQGNEVIGSDTDEKFFTDDILANLGVDIVSFDPSHIDSSVGEVIYSSAYTPDHEQIVAATKLGINTTSYIEALADMFNQKTGVMITGTHGKTTSTAMLGKIMEDAGLDPTVIVGGALIDWGKTAHAGKGKYIVAEGDEYQAKILLLKPKYVLITNIEYDHPDYYPTKASYEDVFKQLLGSLDSSVTVVVPDSLRSFVEENTNARVILFKPDDSREVKLNLWGAHNRMNALSVITLAGVFGIDEAESKSTLSKFRGTKRRLELYSGEDDDILAIDDYAHHPTEIKATLRAVRERFPDRELVAYFQPHTYSRTKALMSDFASSFYDADQVVLLDVYSSAREKNVGFKIEILVDEISKHHKHVKLIHTVEEAIVHAKNLKAGSIVLAMGAGDIWRIPKEVGGI
jgi:UDP-N-acetylmuramate--alanine ligase